MLEPDVDGKAIRRWWTITTRLDGLAAAGTITAGAHEAALALRNDYEIVVQVPGSALSRAAPSGGSADPHVRALSRTAAMTRLRAARAKLGQSGLDIAIMLVVADASFSQLGRRLGCGSKRARKVAAAILEHLAGEQANPRGPTG